MTVSTYTPTYTVTPQGPCRHCGGTGYWHAPGRCQCIKAIEYYPNGTVKRIEYIAVRDHD